MGTRVAALAGTAIRAVAGGVAGAVRATSMLFRRSTYGGVISYARTLIDYRTETGDPMANSAVAAVVGWIARNFPDAPVRVLQMVGGAMEAIPPGPAGAGAMLRLLERPNAYFSGILQWRATVVDFIRGDAYWLKVRNAAGRVVELWWVPAGLIEPCWPLDDPRVFVGWYEMRLDGVVYVLDPADVVHFRNGINPLNTRKGVDQLAPLLREIFTDNEAAAFTATLLRNLGVPGVVIAPANTVAAGAIRGDPEDIKAKFMERTQGDRRGEPMVFTVPTQVQVLSWNPQQLDLKALRRIPEERVAAVLGVPAGVAQLGAGLDRNTFSNYGEANRAAYVQGVLPMHRLIAAELEVQLLPEWVDIAGAVAYDVDFDASVTQAMAEAAEQVWQRAASAAGRGLLTRADFKRLVRLPVHAEDDVYVVPSNYVLLPSNPDQPPPPPVVRQPVPPAHLPPGAPPAGLLTSGRVELVTNADPAGVRCAGCSALLAEMATAPYRFTCRKCHAVTEQSAA